MILSRFEMDDHVEIREGVQRLCVQFDNEYWRKLDEFRAYPVEFVNALTKAGYLSVLVPETYGGSGLGLSAAAAILETIQSQGCKGAACNPAARIGGAKGRFPSSDRLRRTSPPGVRRHRTRQWIRHHSHQDDGPARRKRIYCQWSKDLDEPC